MPQNDQDDTLDELLLKFDEIISLVPGGDPLRLELLSHYAILKIKKFRRRGQMDDLKEAVSKQSQAVEGTVEGHPDLAGRLNNLGSMLASRFERTGRMKDLEESIRRTQQAVDITPQYHPYPAGRLKNLGNMLGSRFERTGRMEDLGESIRRTQQAVDITPQDHPDLAMYLNNFGRRLCLSSQPGHRDHALESFRKPWNCLNGIPFHRVASALQAIRLLKSRSHWSEALAIAKQAISLLPLINNRSLSRDDQQYVASTFSGLTADACSLSLQAGDEPFEALELLELGHGSIMGLLIDDRSDISRLERSHAEEVTTYNRLRNKVNAAVDGIEDAKLRQSRVTRHLEAVNELDECMGNIRKLRKPRHRKQG